jgi:hypothetical protein
MNASVEAVLVNRARWRPAPVPQSSRRSSVVMIWVSPRSLSAGRTWPSRRGEGRRRIDGLPGARAGSCPGEPCRAAEASAAAHTALRVPGLAMHYEGPSDSPLGPKDRLVTGRRPRDWGQITGNGDRDVFTRSLRDRDEL